MAALNECTGCKKKRPGRFTRRKDAAGGGWSQGLTLPLWYCYRCLPHGGGRDENEDNMPTKTAPPVPARINSELVKQEGQAMLQTIQPEAAELTVTCAEEYLIADTMLHKIKTARNTWKEKMEKIIRPIRQGLDEIYALNREVDKPMEQAELAVKEKMKVFKLAEQRQLQAAEEERRREEERLRREAEEKAAAAARAATPQLRGRLQAQAIRAESAAQEVAQQEAPQAVRGASSVTRPVKRVRVRDFIHLIQGIIDGYVPEDAVTVNQTALNQYLKDDPQGMAAWPGIEVYDDVQIVGR